MVYCGKPSRGCQMCRTRRIKCDETKPTCLQCQKSRRQCPGYKNDFDLVFRNETQATERRARRSMAKGKDKKDKETRTTTTSTELIKSPTAAQIAAASHSAPVSVAMEVPVDQQAFCYFLSNYVLMPRTKDTKGFMSYLLPLLQSNDNDSCLSKAVSAVSMAALANRPNSKTLLWKARGLYSQTLLSLNHALRDPVAQLKDETLASVLLMGLFEQMLSMKTNVTAWGSHTEGAVQLVRLRGRKALESPIGRAMFLSVRSSYVVHCFCASKSPEFGIDWWTQLGEGYTDPVYDEIQRLNLHAADVRTQLNTILLTPLRTPENIAKVNAVIQRANALDKEFQEWMQNAPPHWQYKTVAWVENFQGPPEKSEVCPGRVDVYPDVWIASVWNYARVSRLLISGIIIRCVAWMNAPQDYRTTPEYAVSARLGSEIVTDIIASLAFAYGYAKSDATTGGAGFVCGDNTAPHSKSLGAFLNIWPTFSVCNSDYTTDQQRRYCYGRLKYTTHELGVNQAEVLSHFNLRLPSMSIRRDGMALMAAYAAISPEATTHSGSSAAGSPASSTFTRGVSPTSSVSSIGSPTSVSEIDAATREAYEKRFREAVKKTRDEVVKTASNEGGDSSVQTMKNWFGVR